MDAGKSGRVNPYFRFRTFFQGCIIYFDAVGLAVVFQPYGIPITMLIIHFPAGGGIVSNLEDGDAVLGFPIPV
jgi:hypothetical protein